MKRIYTILSCLLLVGMLCIGLYALLDKDATYSESERRKLKTRPKLTFSAMLDGSYASDYRDYFADTFCLYSDRHSSRRYYAEQNAAFVRAKEEGSLLSLVGKWFPQADIAFANKKQQRIDAYFHAQDVLNVPLEKSAVQEIKAYLETVIGQPFRSFNHFMRPYGYAIRKASGNTTSPNYGKQIITRIGTDKT